MIKTDRNDQNNKSYGFYLEKYVIVDAEDLKEVDTACWFSMNGSVHPMAVDYDSQKKTLTVSPPQSNASAYTFFDLDRLYYQKQGVGLDMCKFSSNFYKLDSAPDLSHN